MSPSGWPLTEHGHVQLVPEREQLVAELVDLGDRSAEVALLDLVASDRLAAGRAEPSPAARERSPSRSHSWRRWAILYARAQPPATFSLTCATHLSDCR